MVIISITGGHPKKYSKADRTVGGSVSGVCSFFLTYFCLIQVSFTFFLVNFHILACRVSWVRKVSWTTLGMLFISFPGKTRDRSSSTARSWLSTFLQRSSCAWQPLTTTMSPGWRGPEASSMCGVSTKRWKMTARMCLLSGRGISGTETQWQSQQLLSPTQFCWLGSRAVVASCGRWAETQGWEISNMELWAPAASWQSPGSSSSPQTSSHSHTLEGETIFAIAGKVDLQ